MFKSEFVYGNISKTQTLNTDLHTPELLFISASVSVIIW
jgi:hypothetical protein